MSSWSKRRRNDLHVIPKRCVRPGCSNTFIPKMPHGIYCSNACRASVQRARRQRRRGVPIRYGTRFGTCPNGHDRSEENTYIRPNGSYACRMCNREREKRQYAEDEAHRQRKVEHSRRARAERRDEINARRRQRYAEKVRATWSTD